jgi:lipoprotein NlpI/transglutaminase-like putative cysteine protease
LRLAPAPAAAQALCFNRFIAAVHEPALPSICSLLKHSVRTLRRHLVFTFAAGFALHAGAQVPSPAAPDPALKETSVGANAFGRGVALPAWADVLPVPPAEPTRSAVVMRLEDTHLLVTDKPVILVNLAQQVLDPATLGQIGQVAMQFIPQYQRLVLHRAVILRGEQTIDHTMTAPVRFLQRETGLEQGIFSGVITASLLLPDVRVGDALHLQYSIEGANPIFGGRYVQAVPWQRNVPVQVRRVTLNTPEARPVQWKWVVDGTLPSMTPEASSRNGLKRLRFEERALPGVDLEPMLPRGAYPLRWLQFSEYADWAEVARWADGLFPENEPLPTELVPLVQNWLRLPNQSEQASQALQWVQSQVRYYSVSLGESSHRPHTPAEVLRNRYGDCKDKSFLLMRLLQSMGIPARAVLASLNSPQGPALQLASPVAFDHVVVRARVDGRDYYLDPTRLGQRGPLDRLGQGLEDASVLVVDGRESRALSSIRSPARREVFRSELNETFRLAAFGEDGELEMRQQWNGVAAETMRLTLLRLDPARLRTTLLTGLERRYPGISVAGNPEFSDELDQNRVTLTARFKVPKLATPADGGWTMRFIPANMQGAIAMPALTSRRFALALPVFPISVLYVAEMHWPASVSGLVEPGTQRIANATFNAEVTRSFRGNVARTTLRFEPLGGSVPAGDVPAMVADAKALEKALVGTMSVGRDQVKEATSLGIARQTLQDKLRVRAQTTVDRSGKAIAGGQLGGDDLAQALCLRAQAQAELGALAEAVKDAQEAVRQAPSLAAAWMCRGDALWSRGEFAPAAADFGKALALGAAPAEAYQRRGMARFYEGRADAAADDFAKAAADRSDASQKAYAQLWQALALLGAGKPVTADLQAAPRGEASVWPWPALALIAGQSSPDAVIDELGRKDGDERELALAEGWFYVGRYWLAQRQPDKARQAFEQARAKGITRSPEHVAAGFELQRLGTRR